MSNLIVTIAILLVSMRFSSSMSSSNVQLQDKGYTGVVIAINPEIPEDEGLIDAIKATWTNASRDLYVATKNLAYFKEITILLPRTWTKKDRDPATGNENYDQADVVVALPNPSYGNEPYTEQHGGCGEQGIRSHFTPDYLQSDESVTNYGPRGKVVVHEWAHYRWGVFDETSAEDPFYWDPNNDGSDGPEATRCPASIFGEVRDIQSPRAERRCSLVDIDTTTNSFPSNCVFFPYEEQYYHPNTSIMSYQYMEEVTTFCHDEGDGSKYNTHNIYAPNDQNRLCKMKSTWTVILESPDFVDANTVADVYINDTTPTFKVVKPGSQRFVLVLDVSGSMGGWKIDTLRQTAYKFITVFAPNGSWVGIVQFNSYAARLSDLTLLDSPESREDLARLLPISSGGGTCIGCGITEGINVLEDFSSPAGGRLIVITDGAGTGVENVYAEVLNKGIIVDTVYIETNANDVLTQLTEESGGEWYYTVDGSNMDEIFNQISASDSTESNAYQVSSESFTVMYGETFASSTFIDSTIGLNTVFVFTWLYGTTPPTIYIQSPSGCFFTNYFSPSVTLCAGGSIHEVTSNFFTIKFTIPDIAEVGKWIYTVTPATTTTQTITTVITSEASDNSVPPIMIESGMSLTDVSAGTATVVYAKVTQGYNPILGANVVATVSRPDPAIPVVMNLYDNGAGADIRTNDGIYSRYFTEYSGSGRYSVEVQVGYQNSTGNSTRQISRGSRANYRPGLISASGTANINANGATSPEGSNSAGSGIQSEEIGEFTRVVSSGGFSYDGPAVTVDSFPPGQIIDVGLQQNDLEDFTKGVILKFTAPGDDMDSGTAEEYDIRYTYDDPTSLSRNFTDADQIAQDALIQGNLSDPLSAGSLETFIISTPSLPPDEEFVRLAFAVRANDAAGNMGDPSNIAVINFFVEPLVLTTLPPTTTMKPTTSTLPPTTTKKPTTETPLECPVCEDCAECPECDPNTELYMILMASLSVSTGIFLTSTLVLGIWLSKVNKQVEKYQNRRSDMRGVDGPLELRDMTPAIRNKIVPVYSSESQPVAYVEQPTSRAKNAFPHAQMSDFEY